MIYNVRVYKLYVGAAVLQPYDMKCTSLETQYVGAAVLKPYNT
jgi:hypothetical protein